MPYKVKGKCVYKKEDNTKVGCTKGSVDKYLAALHANVDEANTIKGGKADKLSVKDIADKFNVSVDSVKSQIKKGVKVEMEHTNDKEKATEIATDHISEFPDYYDRLEKVEKKASKEWGVSETKNIIKSLLKEGLTRREVIDFFLELNFFLSLNLSKVQQEALDADSLNELNLMMQNIRKPLINGKNIFELAKEINTIVNNPKMLSTLLSQVKNIIEYVEPRIKKYVKDSDKKNIWLNKISNFKTGYLKIIS
jgi:predicted DNA-binding protein YlxM (UPF0122 family)